MRRERAATLRGVVPAPAPLDGGIDPVALAAFVDSVMTVRMASDRIPGAGFVFVQNGRVLVIRGYGTRDGSNKAVGRDMTFAELEPEEKHRISHRADAFAKLVAEQFA